MASQHSHNSKPLKPNRHGHFRRLEIETRHKGWGGVFLGIQRQSQNATGAQSPNRGPLDL